MKPNVSRTFIEAVGAGRYERPAADQGPDGERGIAGRRLLVSLAVLAAVLAAGTARFGGAPEAQVGGTATTVVPVGAVHGSPGELAKLVQKELANERMQRQG
jgi:hypothetical protein